MDGKEKYRIIGLMSGTSCDGVDLADCIFTLLNGKWNYQIAAARAFAYDTNWATRLITAPELGAREFCTLDVEYGHFLGKLVRRYLNETGVVADAVASHGHTIFHDPAKGMTVQIGSGASLCAASGTTVVCDFRTLDVALGGQGAPLVPIGDAVLFGDYEYALNLGGFSNCSFDLGGARIAFDICPVNIILNELARRMGHEYDDMGRLAAGGSVLQPLLMALNDIPYYKAPHPKSLSREWLETEFIPLLDHRDESDRDKLRTMVEHIAVQIGVHLQAKQGARVLVSGGGTHNDFLIQRMRANSDAVFVIPDETIVDYKEALVFAFLGLMRLRGEINTLNSVTGASANSSGGAVYLASGKSR